MSREHAILLVGHGVPATDSPRELVMRFKALEGRRRAAGLPPSPEERDVDRQLRDWPRTHDNDAYRVGTHRLAEALARRLGESRVAVAYNEFCAPSVEDAVRALASEGARTIRVVATMLTPGGVHAEVEIPEALRALSAELPEVTILYAWPFDLDDAAELFARQLARL